MLLVIVRQTGMVIFARSEEVKDEIKKFVRESCLRVEYDSEKSNGRKCEVEFLLIVN